MIFPTLLETTKFGQRTQGILGIYKRLSCMYVENMRLFIKDLGHS